MKSDRTRALIVGGGIGGLSAAIALERVGLDVLVLEQARELREVGAGLMLWTNATKALAGLGLLDAIAARSPPLELVRFHTWRGEVLAELPIGDLARRLQAPTICVHRAELQQTLLGALDARLVRLDARCTGFEQDDEGVTACLAGGRAERGAILIGADGINSAIRRQLLPRRSRRRHAGYATWRGVAEFWHSAFAPRMAFGTIGRGSEFGMIDMGRGRACWFGTAAPPEEIARMGSKAAALHRYRGWHQPIEAVLDATKEAAFILDDVDDLATSWRWGEGRVTLLGDAAHASTPHLGLGACLAIEDAVVLAGQLSRDEDPVSGLRAYEALRRVRTAALVWWARQIGRAYHWRNPAVCRVRDTMFRGLTRPSLRVWEWILAYEWPSQAGA